jgi:hypothetical protein
MLTMKSENGGCALACGSPHHEERELHSAIETFLSDCDSNFTPVALFRGRFTAMCEN